MLNFKRTWGILGSVAIVLLAGIFQSSVHAAPIGAILLPPAPVVAPVKVNPIAVHRTQQASANQFRSTPLADDIQSFSRPSGMVLWAQTIGQILLAVYGLSMICAGRGAGGAKKSSANVVWGALFIGIALTAPELVGWLMTNNASVPSDVVLPSGGCG